MGVIAHHGLLLVAVMSHERPAVVKGSVERRRGLVVARPAEPSRAQIYPLSQQGGGNTVEMTAISWFRQPRAERDERPVAFQLRLELSLRKSWARRLALVEAWSLAPQSNALPGQVSSVCDELAQSWPYLRLPNTARRSRYGDNAPTCPPLSNTWSMLSSLQHASVAWLKFQSHCSLAT